MGRRYIVYKHNSITTIYLIAYEENGVSAWTTDPDDARVFGVLGARCAANVAGGTVKEVG